MITRIVIQTKQKEFHMKKQESEVNKEQKGKQRTKQKEKPKTEQEKKEQQEQKAKEQESFDSSMWRWKIGMITLVVSSVVGLDFYKFGYYNVSCQIILFVIISWFISFGWSKIFHFHLFEKICEKYVVQEEFEIDRKSEYIKIFKNDKNNNVNRFKYYLTLIFSPDYLYAKIFKYSLSHDNNMNDKCFFRKKTMTNGRHLYSNRRVKCEYNLKMDRYMCERHQEKKRLQKFVIYSNWVNLISAGVLMFICLITSALLKKDDTNNIIKFLFILVLVHIISRAIEVSFAFYNDVVKAKMTKDLKIGERSTNLKRGHRISLAVHTYVEFILLFSILYFLEPKLINSDVFSHLNNYVEFILYSASVAAFNISFDVKQLTTFGKIIHTLQVFLSINLVVLSIATYLGFKDEMSEFEKVDWEKEKKNSR